MNEQAYFEQFVGDSAEDAPAHYPPKRVEYYSPFEVDLYKFNHPTGNLQTMYTWDDFYVKSARNTSFKKGEDK